MPCSTREDYRVIANHRERSPRDSIISISSISAYMPSAREPGCAAAKAALIQFTNLARPSTCAAQDPGQLHNARLRRVSGRVLGAVPEQRACSLPGHAPRHPDGTLWTPGGNRERRALPGIRSGQLGDWAHDRRRRRPAPQTTDPGSGSTKARDQPPAAIPCGRSRPRHLGGSYPGRNSESSYVYDVGCQGAAHGRTQASASDHSALGCAESSARVAMIPSGHRGPSNAE